MVGERDSLELRLDKHRWEEVDAIARATASDRLTIVGEAIDVYLELHCGQVAHAEEGIRQARSGEFVSQEDVAKAFRREA